MVAIPKFGRSKEYILVDEEGNDYPVTIKGYRASDHEFVIKLHKYSAELPSLMSKASILKDIQNKFLESLNEDNFKPELVENNFMSMISSINDDDYSEEEILDLMESVKQIQEMEGEVNKVTYKLGQRGLKRYLYLQDPESRDAYLQAQSENRLTEWLDQQEDIDVDMDHLDNIVKIMIELGKPTRPLPGSGKGKQNLKL